MAEDTNSKLASEWIRELVHDARANDPQVGIFPNEELACELERAASFIESYSDNDFVLSKDPDSLLWGLVHNVKPDRPGKKPLWVCVRDTVGCGATVANELCRKYGRDPDEMVGEEFIEYMHDVGVHIDEDGEVSSWTEQDEIDARQPHTYSI